MTNAWRRRQGATTTVCGADGGLVPHALRDETVSVYAPGPTVPLIERAGVVKLPAKAPVTVTM